ncbi:hypothetical protein [Paraburkholderia sp. MM5384-R2]|uniref:hypothetical protein n=1 Tax=Paraburkholderia sp. MM5384-R2 TaxID=2723097 RepID=UPI0016169D1B|nr:hypothetical protein [Paraburkholderia sp. MM5384-R2]MBB5503120.1 hypothetical protein [Paraburkholderia sp. MM5384-R2]
MLDLVRRLARHLRDNPFAGDTKEGITQWWLGLTPASVDLVEQLLASLQAAGLIESVRGLDGLVHYRRTSPDASTNAQFDRLIANPANPQRDR